MFKFNTQGIPDSRQCPIDHTGRPQPSSAGNAWKVKSNRGGLITAFLFYFLHTSFPFKALYMRKYIKENNNNNINILKRERIWKN